MHDKIVGGELDPLVSLPPHLSSPYQPLDIEERPESFAYNSAYNISHIVWHHPHRVGCVTGASPLLRELVLDAARSARAGMGLPEEWPDG